MFSTLRLFTFLININYRFSNKNWLCDKSSFYLSEWRGCSMWPLNTQRERENGESKCKAKKRKGWMKNNKRKKKNKSRNRNNRPGLTTKLTSWTISSSSEASHRPRSLNSLSWFGFFFVSTSNMPAVVSKKLENGETCSRKKKLTETIAPLHFTLKKIMRGF